MTDIRLMRRREAASVLGLSQAQLVKFDRQGILRPVRIPSLRAVRYVAADVHALAASWAEQSGAMAGATVEQTA